MFGSKQLLVLGATALALSACRDASGPSRTGRLVLSIAARAPAAGPAAASETVSLGADVLVLEKVELVIREIQLNRAGRADGCDTDTDGNDDQSQDGANQDGTSGDIGPDCEEVELGPLLVDLPLGGVTKRQLEVPIMPGTYDKVEFEIHKPDDGDARDVTFLGTNPGFRGVSIRARGTFNGAPFEYLSDLSAGQKVVLSPPLVVADGGLTQLTLTIDVRGWFLDAAHAHLVNPATALIGQPNELLVKGNIQLSIGAEGDDDRDG